MLNVFHGLNVFVKSKMGACGVYSIQEYKWISLGCSGSMSNVEGSAAAALSPVDVVLFGVGEGTDIFVGGLFVK